MAENNKTIYIPIVDGYAWSQDKLNNYTLIYKETREKKELGNGGQGTGEFKEFTECLGYYTCLKSVLKAVLKDAGRRGIESGKIKTIRDYIDTLSDMEEKITDITHGY